MNICILGDSVAKGIIYDESMGKYTFAKNSFYNIISKDKNLIVKNYAKFGCTVKKGIEILNRKFDSLKDYKYTVLEFGGNDCDFLWPEVAANPKDTHLSKVPTDKFVAYYENMLSKIQELGSTPIILTLPPIDSDRFFNWVSKGLNKNNIMNFLGNDVEFIYRWHESYNKAIISLAEKTNTPFIDITNEFISTNDYKSYLCVDGIHPNEKGHLLIANAILKKANGYI